jgi:hypothetical protein
MNHGSCLCGSVKYSIDGSKCSWYSIADELPQFSSTPSAAEFGQLHASAAIRDIAAKAQN